MSEGPAEKRPGFERWVASLKLGQALRPSSAPPPDPESEAEGTPLTLDEQATLINRIPKEVIYKLREKDSNRAMPKSDDSTAVFTPPPELLARAKRFEAPPKPERSSPMSSPKPERSSPMSSPAPVPRGSPPPSSSRAPVPRPSPPPGSSPSPLGHMPQAGLSAAEAAAFATLSADEEATTLFRPDTSGLPSTSPPPALQELSRPGDIQWIDGLPTERPPAPSEQVAPVGGSMAPAERRLRWVAIVVALALLAGIYALSRMQ